MCELKTNLCRCLLSCPVCVCVCVLQKAYCGHCSERIWGLGRQGYKCINCKLLVHKRCHRLIPQTCQRLMVSIPSRPEQQARSTVSQCRIQRQHSRSASWQTLIPSLQYTLSPRRMKITVAHQVACYVIVEQVEQASSVLPNSLLGFFIRFRAVTVFVMVEKTE